jgi:hypothetical protein
MGISRAAYYKWTHRKVTAHELENQAIRDYIIELEEKNHYIFGVKLKADTQIVHLCQSFVHSRQEIVHLGHKIVQSKTLLLTIFGRRSVLR